MGGGREFYVTVCSFYMISPSFSMGLLPIISQVTIHYLIFEFQPSGAQEKFRLALSSPATVRE
jgi:hypothetical protein